MYPHRPSDRELDKKINEAKSVLRQQLGLFANFAKAVGELNELDMRDSDDIWQLIRGLLEEISPKDYAGGKPPQKSYEKAIANCELFAFCWWSKTLGKQMYIKFALRQNRYFYVSLHESRKQGGE